MTRLWPTGEPIQITLGPAGQPQAFCWRGRWHPVAAIANRWRVRTNWWSIDTQREYVKLTTTDGLLCTLRHDLRNGGWFFDRLYD